MAVRAIRGATTCKNTKEDIFSAAHELIDEIIAQNELSEDDMIDIIFTVTPDLDAAFPAAAIRRAGIVGVPLLDVLEPKIQGALEKCIRVMVHFNTEKTNRDLKHVYLRDAVGLRPDLLRK